MYSEKEYQIKIRKLEREIERLNKKKKLDKESLSELRLSVKRLKQRVKELKQSRDNWKNKQKDKQQENKLLKAKIANSEKVARHPYGVSLMRLCVLLRVIGGCSYRGVIRVLKVLVLCKLLTLTKLPCANTVQNWTSKLGLKGLQQAVKEPISQEVTLIVDECIRKGKEKQLIVLLAPFEKVKEGALSFQDVQLVYMEGSESWKGQQIKQTLSFLLDSPDLEIKNVLSDQGGNLVNFSKLIEQIHIPDIAHGVATCLKKTFLKDPDYKSFISLIGTYIQKGVNQDLSYLCPPKLGKKARFMNQEDIVSWAKTLTERISKLDEKSNAFFAQLPQYTTMIHHLSSCIDLGKRIQVPLKKQGASKETLVAAKQVIGEGKRQGDYAKIFVTYLEEYLFTYEKFINQHTVTNIHVSSDIIESLFGKYKSIANHSALTGLTKLNLELVTYCMNTSKLVTLIPIALEDIYMSDLENWVIEHSSENQLIKRRKFFEKTTIKTEKKSVLN